MEKLGWKNFLPLLPTWDVRIRCTLFVNSTHKKIYVLKLRPAKIFHTLRHSESKFPLYEDFLPSLIITNKKNQYRFFIFWPKENQKTKIARTWISLWRIHQQNSVQSVQSFPTRVIYFHLSHVFTFCQRTRPKKTRCKKKIIIFLNAFYYNKLEVSFFFSLLFFFFFDHELFFVKNVVKLMKDRLRIVFRQDCSLVFSRGCSRLESAGGSLVNELKVKKKIKFGRRGGGEL